MSIAETPPVTVAHRAVTGGRHPTCGACGRPLAHDKQWRCPYVTCREWLRTIDELDAA